MLLPTNVLTDENYVTEEEDDYQWWTEEDLWKFPPPPPRPPFLEPPYPDGLTTCDLCTWALQPLDGTDNGMLTVPIAEVTWPMILVLVSLLSAAIGALFMVVFLHLKLRLSGRTAPSRPECLVSFDPPTDRVHHHHHHQQLHHHQRQIAQIAAGDQYHLNHMNHLNHLNNLNNRRAGPIVRRSGGSDGTASKHNGPGRPSVVVGGIGGGGGVGGGGGGGLRNGGDGGGGAGGVGGGGDDARGAGGGVGQLSVNPGDWFRWFRRKRGAVLPPDAVPSNQNAVRANHYTVEEAAAAIPAAVMVYASVIGGPDDGRPPPPPLHHQHHHHNHQQSRPSSLVNDDVLYTELDRVPTPAYHNAGYAFDQHSSAYYSDMYEPIDPYHRGRLQHDHDRQNSLPSDYV